MENPSNVMLPPNLYLAIHIANLLQDYWYVPLVVLLAIAAVSRRPCAAGDTIPNDRRKNNVRTSVVGQVANLPVQPVNPNPMAGWQPAPRNLYFRRS